MRINDKYRTERDQYQHILVESVQSKKADGVLGTKERRTYHATLQQALEAVVDREAGECPDAQSLLVTLNDTVREIRRALDHKQEAES